jgi:hypothetical protein
MFAEVFCTLTLHTQVHSDLLETYKSNEDDTNSQIISLHQTIVWTVRRSSAIIMNTRCAACHNLTPQKLRASYYCWKIFIVKIQMNMEHSQPCFANSFWRHYRCVQLTKQWISVNILRERKTKNLCIYKTQIFTLIWKANCHRNYRIWWLGCLFCSDPNLGTWKQYKSLKCMTLCSNLNLQQCSGDWCRSLYTWDWHTAHTH